MAFIDSNFSLTALGGDARPPAVAGSFYPANPERLRETVRTLLAGARPEGPAPKCVIAPHAGYVYSGPVAASAYAAIASCRDRIHRVVLLGPAHRVYLRGLALPSATIFRTPLGDVEIDGDGAARLRAMPQVCVMDEAHALEHSLEVHLPFLQVLLDRFSLVPLVVGDADPRSVAEVLEALWGGEETLIVISSDLSHYHDYETARRLDRETGAAIEDLDYGRIGPEEACGCMPLGGLLALARRRRLRVTLLDLRNSGDTAGPRDRVVGYGAFAVHETSASAGDRSDDAMLLQIARSSIGEGFETRRPMRPDPGAYPAPFRSPAALFVTLMLGEKLRGCIGTTEARDPMVIAAANCAFDAAFHDPRFEPLQRNEFPAVALSVSILGPRVPLRFGSDTELIEQLRPGTDGLVIRSGDRQATFLPAVWETITSGADFLHQLKLKGGMETGKPPERAWRYTVRCISERRDTP